MGTSATQLASIMTKVIYQVIYPENLASTKQGGKYRILRSFYIHAIRSAADYAANSLVLLPREFARLNPMQNRAMWTIPGPPT